MNLGYFASPPTDYAMHWHGVTGEQGAGGLVPLDISCSDRIWRWGRPTMTREEVVGAAIRCSIFPNSFALGAIAPSTQKRAISFLCETPIRVKMEGEGREGGRHREWPNYKGSFYLFFGTPFNYGPSPIPAMILFFHLFFS